MNKHGTPVDDSNTDAIVKALSQTISDSDFNSEGINKIAEHLHHELNDSSLQDETIDDILAETLADDQVDQVKSAFRVDLETADDKSPTAKGGDNNIHQHSADAQLNQHNTAGRYTIEATLGTGATGQVFSVHDNNFNRDIAVKFMHPRDAGNKQRLLKFIDEARVTAKLDHPNILPIHDLDYTSSTLIYFTMGRADGYSLHTLIEQAKNDQYIPPLIAHINDHIRIMIQVCNAVAYAHTQSVIHNDIKPSNIMIGHYGEVLVVDWGTASNDSRDTDNNSGQKRMYGTPLYMSPEQARREGSSPTSDIYCIGSTFYHLLTKRYACWDKNVDTFWKMKRAGTISDFTKKEKKYIPRELQAIVLKALEADAEKRYQSAADITHDLEAYQQGLSISAHKDSVKDICARLYRYNRKTVWASLSGLALISLLLCWLFFEKYSLDKPWIETLHEDYQGNSLEQILADWENTAPSTNSPWALADGELTCTPQTEEEATLIYKKGLAGNLRVNWSMQINASQSSFYTFIGGKKPNNSYCFQFTQQENNLLIQLRRQNELIPQLTHSIPYYEIGDHNFIITKTQTQITLSIDKRYVIQYDDPETLTGSNFHGLGFIFPLNVSSRLNHMHLFTQALPVRTSPLSISHTYYSEGLIEDALQHYQQLYSSYSNSDISATSLYRIGKCFIKLNQLPQARLHFQQFLQLYPQHKLHEHALSELTMLLWHSTEYAHCLETLKTYSDKHYSKSFAENIRTFIEQDLQSTQTPESRLRDETAVKIKQLLKNK